jgi:hypothetical protein
VLLREAAGRIVTHAWLERALFEVVGRWSADEADADAARLFAVQSRHHGWRSQRWAELVPVLHDVEPAVEGVDGLDALAGLDETLDRLVGADGALALVLERYRAHQAAVTEVADGPARRALRIVTQDAEADRQAIAALLRTWEPSLVAARRSLLG